MLRPCSTLCNLGSMRTNRVLQSRHICGHEMDNMVRVSLSSRFQVCHKQGFHWFSWSLCLQFHLYDIRGIVVPSFPVQPSSKARNYFLVALGDYI